MKNHAKHLVLFLVMLSIFMLSTAYVEDYSGPYSFSPTLTNSVADQSGLTNKLWMSTPTTRALISVCLLCDASLDYNSENKLDFADFAELDTSYVFKQEDLLGILYRGAGEKKNDGIVLMYSPNDRDAAYTIYHLSEEEITYAMLAKAITSQADLFYENEISEVMKIWSSFGNDTDDENDCCLNIIDVKSEKQNGNKLAVIIRVRNNSTEKTINSFTVKMNAEDKNGYSLQDSEGYNYYYETTEHSIPPGEELYSNPIILEKEDEIAVLYVGISQLEYSDGAKESIKDVSFFEWNYE